MLADENILLAFVVVFAALTLVALHGWHGARKRNANLLSLVERSQQNASSMKALCGEALTKMDELRAENAALRSQVNQRGAGGRFAKKSPTE